MIIWENIKPCSPNSMSILGMIGSRMPVSTSGGMLSMPAAPLTTSSATIDTQGKLYYRLLNPLPMGYDTPSVAKLDMHKIINTEILWLLILR